MVAFHCDAESNSKLAPRVHAHFHNCTPLAPSHFKCKTDSHLRECIYNEDAQLGSCSRDPIGYEDGTTVYQYSHGNSIVLTDPSGEQTGTPGLPGWPYLSPPGPMPIVPPRNSTPKLPRTPTDADKSGEWPVYPGQDPPHVGVYPIVIWYDPRNYEECINACAHRQISCKARGMLMCALLAIKFGKCLNKPFLEGDPPKPTPGTDTRPGLFFDCLANYWKACDRGRSECVKWCAGRFP